MAKNRKRRNTGAAPRRKVHRHPPESMINALLVGMLGRRARDETSAGDRVKGMVHVWGFGCVDAATVDRQRMEVFTGPQIADGSALEYAFGMQQRLPGIWGYGYSYLGWVGSLTPGGPMTREARDAFIYNRMADCWTPQLMFGAVVFDVRAGMHTASMAMFTPEVGPHMNHTDSGPSTADFMQAFHEGGAIDADLWFAALALDIDRNERILHDILPTIASPHARRPWSGRR